MNKIGLCMVVKDEGLIIDRCLCDIYDLFHEIVIVDTGSTDNTKEVLTNYNVMIIEYIPDSNDPEVLMHARNISLKENKSDWILVLDADEIISRNHIEKLIWTDLPLDGYFIPWRNYRSNHIFDDYKLNLFRNGLGIVYNGLIHCEPQYFFRKNKLEAGFLSDIYIDHKQQSSKDHRNNKIDRLRKYVTKYPTWHRYKWFLGYNLFKEGKIIEAIGYLEDMCEIKSKDFPIELLNSFMVLIEIKARFDTISNLTTLLEQMENYYRQVKDDFEMCANTAIIAWIQETRNFLRNQDLTRIRAREFAY